MLNHKFILTLFLLPFISFSAWHITKNRVKDTNAYHSGGLEINTGAPHGKPIFTLDDFKPGDCEVHEITAKNTTKESQNLTVWSFGIDETGGLSSALTLQISENTSHLYSQSLDKFFDDSKTANGLVLTSIPKNSTKKISFKVCFDINAGNEFQEMYVEFDLAFGSAASPMITHKPKPTLKPTQTPKPAPTPKPVPTPRKAPSPKPAPTPKWQNSIYPND